MTSRNTAMDLYNSCGMTPTVHSFPNKRKLSVVTRIEQGTFKLLVTHMRGDELEKDSHIHTVVYTGWTLHSSVTLYECCHASIFQISGELEV